MGDQKKTVAWALSGMARIGTPSLAESGGIGNAAASALDEITEKRLDQIEMIGEEQAAGFQPPPHSEVTAGMRYLHCSRTIHQLVTDRNRAVGIYLAVASLLWTASGAMLNARPNAALKVPIETIKALVPAGHVWSVVGIGPLHRVFADPHAHRAGL